MVEIQVLAVGIVLNTVFAHASSIREGSVNQESASALLSGEKYARRDVSDPPTCVVSSERGDNLVGCP